MSKSLEELKKALFLNTQNFSLSEKELLKRALNFAIMLHSDSKRADGQPFITHPIRVAQELSTRNFDAVTVVSAILHDALSCDLTSTRQIEEEFGSEICEIVSGVNKISSLPIKEKHLFFSPEHYYFERVDNYRKLLLSASSDIRIIIIKLFERLHNLQTIAAISESKRPYYALETVEIYAQIAERIGLGELKRQLEDLAFPHAYPEDYKRYQKIISKLPKTKQNFINQKISEIERTFFQNDLKVIEFQGRIKHHFSIYKKLKINYDFDLSKFYDLYAMRIIVGNIADCYRALGIIHSMYSPVPGRIYDLIAEPRSNGYQSLHTTLKDSGGKIFEVQIRTQKMHDIAEYGPAAHWQYKESSAGGYKKIDTKSNKEWLNELKPLRRMRDNKEFLSYLKKDLFSKKIFVFSPKGDIYNLPHGATVLDFAFRVHTKLGEKCFGAKINHKISGLGTTLSNGDLVEIIISPKAKPNINWLSLVETSHAKQKIKKILKDAQRDELLACGKSIFSSLKKEHSLPDHDDAYYNRMISKSRLPYKNFPDLLVALAEKVVSPHSVLKILYPESVLKINHRQKSIIQNQEISALDGILCEIAKCCAPNNKDKITGYIGKDHKVKIHKQNCKFIRNSDPKRKIYIDPFDSQH